MEPHAITQANTRMFCFFGTLLLLLLLFLLLFGICVLIMSKRCVNGQLGPSVTSSLFTITVSAPQLLEDQLPLEASGVVGAAGIWGGFIVGPGITGPQTFCPLTPASSCPPGIQTVFDGTSMVS